MGAPGRPGLWSCTYDDGPGDDASCPVLSCRLSAVCVAARSSSRLVSPNSSLAERAMMITTCFLRFRNDLGRHGYICVKYMCVRSSQCVYALRVRVTVCAGEWM